MKIIVVEQIGNKSRHATFNEKAGRVSTLADTSLLTHGKPVFVPDWGGLCRATWSLAVRISRLGKSVEARFAPRYYDALGLAVKFELPELKTALLQDGLPVSAAETFDGAVAAGDFTECGNIAGIVSNACVSVGNEEKTFPIVDAVAAVDAAIEDSSAIFTIRQGDIMILPWRSHSFAANPDTHVVGRIGEKKVLEFNVK